MFPCGGQYWYSQATSFRKVIEVSAQDRLAGPDLLVLNLDLVD
jgi:hypothetical protein